MGSFRPGLHAGLCRSREKLSGARESQVVAEERKHTHKALGVRGNKRGLSPLSPCPCPHAVTSVRMHAHTRAHRNTV